MSIIICAEAGLNHGGSLDEAKKLAIAAKSAGADIVKYQTYVPFELMRRDDPDYDLLSKLALPLAAFSKLAKFCDDIGIEFMTTVEELTSLKFVVEELGVKRIKLGSGDLTNSRLQFAVRQTKLLKIQSTGMGSFAEIDAAVAALGVEDLTLLHCVSCYPCKMDQANLAAINRIRAHFQGKGFFHVKVGYSDHTAMSSVIACAAARGAQMIEAHIMLSNNSTVPVDEAVSYDIGAFRHMVNMVRNVEKMCGSGVVGPNDEEMKNIPKFRKGADGKRGQV
jgi:N,N'-diacetyllegionaminate synthase